MPFKISHRAYFWLRVAAVALVVVLAIQFLRVNTSDDTGTASRPAAPKYTPSGPVASGRVTVPAAEYLSYPLKLNKRSTLKGSFRTERFRGEVECLVLDAANFETWRSGGEFKAVVKTGNIPGGNVNAQLSPGDYVLVIDNRPSKDAARNVEIEIVLE